MTVWTMCGENGQGLSHELLADVIGFMGTILSDSTVV